MPKILFGCDICNTTFLKRSGAIRCEKSHIKKCANPECGVTFVDSGTGKLYCCDKCRNLVKQRRHRERRV